MIVGIGTDIVDIARMQESLGRHGERFAARLLADPELEQFRRSKQPAAFLAKRFAAKEATAKAFGTGFVDGLSLRHIAVDHDRRGRPELILSARARELADEMGVTATFVSIADERQHAIAFVTLVSDTHR